MFTLFFIYALDYSEISNVLLEWLTPLLRIREVVGSNLGPEVLTEVSVVFLSPSRHTPGQYLKLGHDRFFHILFISSLFITISFGSVYYVTEKTPLNKVQITIIQ
jgi:hypothetical protein